jgi:glyoxylase-like metal-dependent hydrolase (beta-lactamase superfamily II)
MSVASRVMTIFLMLILLVSTVVGEESEATKLLKARTAEFEQDVIKVTEGVYTAVGYSVSPVSMIVGEDGVVIVDTGMDTISAERVLADFHKITKKPVKAVIFTHGHGDHTGGISVFIGDGKPPSCSDIRGQGHTFSSDVQAAYRVSLADVHASDTESQADRH